MFIVLFNLIILINYLEILFNKSYKSFKFKNKLIKY